jgi:hypothetical protein
LYRWAFEIIAITAGAMGDLSMSAQSINMTVDSVFAVLPFGLVFTPSCRICKKAATIAPLDIYFRRIMSLYANISRK